MSGSLLPVEAFRKAERVSPHVSGPTQSGERRYDDDSEAPCAVKLGLRDRLRRQRAGV